MHSQFEEEAYILDFFLRVPCGCRFLDIGAHDGKEISNTYALAERTWGGLCVEPNPVTFAKLEALYKDRADIKLLNAALSLETGVTIFHHCVTEGVSTLETRWVEIAGGPAYFHPFYICSLGVDDFFKFFGTEWDFLSLDTEGLTLALLQAFPLKDWPRLRMICSEHEASEDVKRETHQLLEPLGFKFVAETKANLLFSR